MATLTEPEWKRVQPSDAPPYRVFTKSIVKSEQDDRDYRIIQLENGLQAMLVHDPKADKAAASLDVAVGHLFDPDDMPGLAHFCEHLLFMGTEQFPKENEYSEYLAKHNGSSNAYTSTTNTNYYFHVATSALPGSLERFSGFFHSPLFSPSCTSRELNAVDSEHKKNHQSDMWRIFQLNKYLSKPGHVWSKFGSGSRTSLTRAAHDLKNEGKLDAFTKNAPLLSVTPSPNTSRTGSPAPSIASAASESESDGGAVGRETRRRLVEWWKKEYCASRMRLCIIGRESLDDLAQLVNAYFSPIPNRGRDPFPMINDHPFGSNEKGTIVSVDTVMAFHAVEISFPLEYQPPFWKYKPMNLISHFVGHEGPGSLFSYLKNKHWVSSLTAGPQSLARGFAMFKVTIHLTPQGFENYRSVVLATFNYLSLLRSSVLEDFHQKEVATMSHTRFRFSEKRRPDDYATWVTEHMAWPIPRDLVIAGPQLTDDWESDADRSAGMRKIQQYLESFRPQEGRVVLMAKKEDIVKIHPDTQWEKEPWYSTEHSVQRMDEAFLNSCNSTNKIPELFLPGPNEFIPTNLDVDRKQDVVPLKRPHLIRQTAFSTLWHKKDDTFWVPKAHVVIDLRSPLGNSSPRAAVLTRLYADIVNDKLSEYSYDADLAGLSYSFSAHPGGLYITTAGYNDKMSVLVEHVLERIGAVSVDPERLEVFKEQTRREWENFFLGQSHSLSDYYARYSLNARSWTYEERLKELPSIEAKEVEEHIKELLSQVNMRIFVAGNISTDEAMKIAEMADDGVSPTSLTTAELNEHALLLPQGSNFVWSAPILNINQANSALTYFTYYGPTVDDKLRVTSALLTQILSEPAFNVLRTREQLGYIVSCTSWALPGSSERGLRIVVQSEKAPAYLETRVEAFLDEMKTKLEEMPEEEFLEHRNGLRKKWLEADKNLLEEVGRFLSHISSNQLDFLRAERSVGVLDSTTKEDVYNLFLTKVHPSSSTRRKLSVHMISQKLQPKKVSPSAISAFEALVKQHYPDIDEKGWRAAVESETPTLVEFGQYWMPILNSPQGMSVLMQLPGLLEKFPLDDGEARLPGAIYLDDLKAFRAGLTAAPDTGPMQQWNDLMVSKF